MSGYPGARNVEDMGDANYPKTAGNVIGGHKANINNPRNSEESKAHSKEVLEKIHGGSDTASSTAAKQEKDHGNVKRGLKATISNPTVSEEATERAKDRLEKGDF
ncbi:hypothetical protein DFH27DRAFT_541789 [Peziza echinospora]|nr:hypothetical protein DFH27DRAFT_541789 [Peziza echinospora]